MLQEIVCEWGLERGEKISSSNTIKSSDSHKNYIKEQWRRRTRAKGPTQIALRELLTCPHSSVVQNFFLLKNHFSLLWGKKLQTQLRLLLMWQAGRTRSVRLLLTRSFPFKDLCEKKEILCNRLALHSAIPSRISKAFEEAKIKTREKCN